LFSKEEHRRSRLSGFNEDGRESSTEDQLPREYYECDRWDGGFEMKSNYCVLGGTRNVK